MIKHIFCDLDGTLLMDFREINVSDIKALQMAQQNGIRVSIATGRLDYEIKMIMEKYQLSGYRISQNGAVVFDEYDNLIYENILLPEDVLAILEVLKNENVIIFYQTKDSYFVEKKLPIITEFETSQPFIKYIEKPNILQELTQYQFVNISLWIEKDYNLELKKILDKILPNHLESYVSSRYTLDITNKINSKGNAINQLGIISDVIAVIGDSQNDISMFKITSNSFVMENADELTKKYAKYTVKNVTEAVRIILENNFSFQ